MTPFRIGFLLYPNLTQLDLTGPAQILHRMPGAELHYLWKNLEPVPSDCGLALMPTMVLVEAPQLDMRAGWAPRSWPIARSSPGCSGRRRAPGSLPASARAR